jgi:hypothetical protein
LGSAIAVSILDIMAYPASHGMLVGDAHPTCKEGAIAVWEGAISFGGATIKKL